MRLHQYHFKAKSSILVLLILVVLLITAACSDMMKSFNEKKWPFLPMGGTTSLAPVLDNLSITGTDASSITLAKPALSTTGDPLPAVIAYIGLEGTISITGPTVAGSIEGPIDVSSNNYKFNALTERTRYRIIVVASNSHGYSVKHITQLTRGTGLWTWVSGDNTINQSGVYGTKGVAADSNKPGSRYCAVSWIDSSGNLWLFGGYGYDVSGSICFLNDLWKFDGTIWTWVSGDITGTQSGVYGTKGVAADTNKPGARRGPVSWIDISNNLWLFGGYDGNNYLNDLWKFDGSRWTWVSGDNSFGQPGVYGTKGVAADTNKPGAREFSVSWIDSSGNFWLFGGGWPGAFNDLWKFDGSWWTWVSGDNIPFQIGVYGTKGVPAVSNKPGARGAPISWIDSSGNLWLFGGDGYDSSRNFAYFNDLWKFDGSWWTWVSGDNIPNQSGVYGTKGLAADSNKPGARWGSVSWIDFSGNFWLFDGHYPDGSGSYFFFNDLWKFDGSRWTWISGDNVVNQSGVCGAKGVATNANKPGARGHSISWIDSSGNFWLFSGYGYDSSGNLGFQNDLWKYSPE